MKKTKGLDIIVEDMNANLWVAALEGAHLAALEIDPDAEIIRWGSVYWGRVLKVDKGLNAAFVDLGYELQGFLPASEIVTKTSGTKTKLPVTKMLKAGDMVLVQIKTPHQPQAGGSGNAAKLPVLSMDIALQGRYLIYTPLTKGNRVSRRVQDPALRQRMTQMAKSIGSITGCILRAASASCQTDVLIREGEILKAMWEQILGFAEGDEACLLMMGPDAVARTLSDLAALPIATITVSSPERADEADTWCDLFAPELRQKIVEQKIANTRSGMGLFEARDLLGQVEELLQPVVAIDGGTLHFDQTEALLAVDVNASGGSSLLTTNLNACAEIARQLRLRNAGGLVVVDFAGKPDATETKKIKQKLQESLAYDSATVECYGPSKLGLYEMARKRRTPSLFDRMLLLAED